MRIRLPAEDGTVQDYEMRAKAAPEPSGNSGWNRTAYAAAHIVCDPLFASSSVSQGAIDWETTAAYREYLWDCGFGIAEAMDTAQRGMGLGWPDVQTIIRRTLADASGRDVVCGVGTDQLDPAACTLDDIRGAYEEQLEFVESLGGRAILMASRALPRTGACADDYSNIYSDLIRASRQPIILHWLGEIFDPLLKGYWGHDCYETAAQTVLSIINDHREKIEGIKISLLDKEKEISFRKKLPAGVKLFTGDDFNYPELIAGADGAYSDALLGVFDPIAPVASAALAELGRGNMRGYHDLLDATTPFARHVFETPTQFYKAGVVFLAWLNGHQCHFTMLGGMQTSRSVLHFVKLFQLADIANLFREPELSRDRMSLFLRLNAGMQ